MTLLSQEKKTRREVASAQRHEFVVLVDARGVEEPGVAIPPAALQSSNGKCGF